MKRRGILIVSFLLVFASFNIIEVAANPTDLDLGDTYMTIGWPLDSIDIDDFDDIYWDDNDAPNGYKLKAYIVIDDLVPAAPPGPGSRDFEVKFTLLVTDYPDGRTGDSDDPVLDQYSTGQVTFDQLQPLGPLRDQYNGFVDLTLYYQSAPCESKVEILAEIYDWQQNLLKSDSISFWIIYTTCILGVSTVTMHLNDEDVDIPDLSDIIYSDGDWDIVADFNVTDNCDPANKRSIRIQFELGVIDYPDGRTGDPGNMTKEDWFNPSESGFTDFDGDEDDTGELRLDVEGPVSPQELQIHVELVIYEEGIGIIAILQETCWISEAT